MTTSSDEARPGSGQETTAAHSDGQNYIDRLPAKDRLILALDCNDMGEVLGLVEQLKGTVSFFKVGLELFSATGLESVRALIAENLKVFLDMKMNDVEETIRRSVRQVTRLGVDFLTIHGNRATAKAATEGRGDSKLKILSVTLLTSLNEQDLRDLYLLGDDDSRFKKLDDYVIWRARQALDLGCDGLITSGQNVGLLRETFKAERPILVCPGIRPSDSSSDEHKRPSTPYDAILHGADYLVVGRPIRCAPNPKDKAEEIIKEIDEALKDRTR